MYTFSESFIEQLCNDGIFRFSNVRTNVRAYETKPKTMEECSIELGMKADK